MDTAIKKNNGELCLSLILGNYWSQHNTEDQNRNVKYPRLTYTNTTNTYTGSDYWLFNGAYFRVKNITLGYSLPQKLMDKCFIRGLRIYATINDLPAISHYPKGWGSGNRCKFRLYIHVFYIWCEC